MKKLNYRRKWSKSEMERTLVIYFVRSLTLVSICVIAVKTYALLIWGATDISDIFVFVATAFGGELLLLAFKRIFAKKDENNNSDTFG